MAITLGGGGSASFPTIFLHNSQTWVPPQDGNIMIHVIGAGGSGCGHTSLIYQSGAAGGYCRKNSLAVTTSGSFTVVVGAGGAYVINATAAGATGGTTSVSGTGLGSKLTATGGAGGATATSGIITIKGCQTNAYSPGGLDNVQIIGGDSATFDGGNVLIKGGNRTTTTASYTGGDVRIEAGDGTAGTASAGTVRILGGTPASGTGGGIRLEAADGVTSGAGGTIDLVGGAGVGAG